MMKGYLYQSFWFKNEIKKHFYAGAKFENHKAEDSILESFQLARDMGTDKESFMPGLVKKIEWLLGEGNFIYDFWEFGEEDFSIYWHIKKEVYSEKMKLIEDWVKYEGFQHICEFKILDPDSEEAQENEEYTFKSGIFNDDGSPIALTKLPTPELCKSCKKYQSDFWEDDLLCALNRNDQRDGRHFECGAYEKADL